MTVFIYGKEPELIPVKSKYRKGENFDKGKGKIDRLCNNGYKYRVNIDYKFYNEICTLGGEKKRAGERLRAREKRETGSGDQLSRKTDRRNKREESIADSSRDAGAKSRKRKAGKSKDRGLSREDKRRKKAKSGGKKKKESKRARVGNLVCSSEEMSGDSSGPSCCRIRRQWRR